MQPDRVSARVSKRMQKNTSNWPLDFDPEGDVQNSSESDDLSSDAEAERRNPREHYAPVPKSKLRRTAVEGLDSRYVGSHVDRNSALREEEDHDPFEGYSDEDESDAEIYPDERVFDNSERYSEEEDSSANASEDEAVVEEEEEEVSHDALTKLVNADRKHIASTIAGAISADIDKGIAVKRQRAAFDSLLNCRIRLQQGLIASNTLAASKSQGSAPGNDAIERALDAAKTLWKNLESLRAGLHGVQLGEKRKRVDLKSHPDLSSVWNEVEMEQQATKKRRNATVQKWITKTDTRTNIPRIDQTAPQQETIEGLVGLHLTSMDRLVQRTKVPRSCAPVQAKARLPEADEIYDDADFYGVMLKELLERRNASGASAINIDSSAQDQYRAAREAKTRRSVDTKASKGRKLRYTVHEKLQNFMVPDDRGVWRDRQIDELFGSLLGKRLALDEDLPNAGEDERNGDLHEEEALMLFRSNGVDSASRVKT